MKKTLTFAVSLLLLTSCGSSGVPENRSEDVKKSPTPITTPSKKRDVNVFVAPAGKVISCSDVRFHSAPEKDLILNCLDGAQGFNVGAIAGPAIINVWGSWCPPCVKEIPIFVEFYDSLDPKVQLVGLDFQDGPLFAVQPFIEKSGITWPNFADQSGAARAYFGSSVPLTWFIDSNNEVVYKKFGPVASLSELKALSKKYLGVS
jgi:cytochrome c biogenesis protein CcmG/thiol:disulfide interchange protein DsbE